MVRLRPRQEPAERLDPQPGRRARRGADPQLPGPQRRRQPGAGHGAAGRRQDQPRRPPLVGQPAAGGRTQRPDHHADDAQHPGRHLAGAAGGIPHPAGVAPGQQLSLEVLPGPGEIRVVAAQIDFVPAGKGGVEDGGDIGGAVPGTDEAEIVAAVPRHPGTAGPADVGSVAADVDGAVDRHLDQPCHLVLGPDLLGQHDAAVRGIELRRRRELGGGHGLELLLVDARPARRGVGTRPRRRRPALRRPPARVRRAGPATPSIPPPAAPRRRLCPRAAQAPFRGRRAAWPAARAAPGRRQVAAGPGLDRHAFAGVEALHRGHQVTRCDFPDRAAALRAGDALRAGGVEQLERGDHVDLRFLDGDLPADPDRLPVERRAPGHPGQRVVDAVAVAARDGDVGVADPDPGALTALDCLGRHLDGVGGVGRVDGDGCLR